MIQRIQDWEENEENLYLQKIFKILNIVNY